MKEEKKGLFAFRVVWGDAEFATTTSEASQSSADKSSDNQHPSSLDTMLSDNTDDKVKEEKKTSIDVNKATRNLNSL